MSFGRNISPAVSWRAFFVCSLAFAAPLIGAPAPKPPELAQVGLPDAAEAQQILQQFRQAGIPGEYFLEFEFHGLPRRGDEVVYRGRYWGGRNQHGAINRIEFTDAAGKTTRLLVQNGEQPGIWRATGARVTPGDIATSFQPLIAGLEITAFDLQMPFLYWPNGKLDRLARVLGRPAHAFVFPAPPEIKAQQKDLAAVRAFFDTQFNALMRIEYLGAGSKTLKTIALLNFQKVGEQYVPKSFDVRNEVTRDKTRFVVTGAALNLDLAPAVFEPAALAEVIQPPAGIVRLNP